MNININKTDLLTPLLKIIGVIERRQTLPILSNVFFSLEGSELKLVGTDLEVQILATSNIETSGSFSITIPARKLLDICRSLPDDSIISMNFGDDKLVLKSGKSRFTLRTLPATEYPLFDDLQYIKELTISKEILFKAFSKTSFCMAQQDVRFYLNGLMLHVSAGELQSVASDGHRLALFKIDLGGSVLSIDQVIIPRKAAQEFQRLLDKTDKDVVIKVAKNHINLSLGDVELNAKLIDGRFPDFKNVIPEENKTHFVIDKQAFKAALSRVSILSNEKYKGIRLDLSDQLMTINANNPEHDEAIEEVPIDYDSNEMSMGFNSSYLMDALNTLDSDIVRVSFTDTNSSCLIEDPNDLSCRLVIMPMRL